MQFDFGYYYAGGLFWFNSICLFICVIYAFEPIRTWIRYRHLRLEQIRLAIELRARLIIEAKERKEARKQRKLDNFNNFTIDLGEGEQAEEVEEEQIVTATDKPKKVGGRLSSRNSQRSGINTAVDQTNGGLGVIKEEAFEGTLKGSVVLE